MVKKDKTWWNLTFCQLYHSVRSICTAGGQRVWNLRSYQAVITQGWREDPSVGPIHKHNPPKWMVSLFAKMEIVFFLLCCCNLQETPKSNVEMPWGFCSLPTPPRTSLLWQNALYSSGVYLPKSSQLGQEGCLPGVLKEFQPEHFSDLWEVHWYGIPQEAPLGAVLFFCTK